MATTAGLTRWMKSALGALAAQLAEDGYAVRLYSGKRTIAQQRALVKSGASRTMQSKHLEGRAVDLIITAPGWKRIFGERHPYSVAGKYWTELGGIWGGDFSDPALAAVEYQHFEDGGAQVSAAAAARPSKPSASARSSAPGSRSNAVILARLRAINRRR